MAAVTQRGRALHHAAEPLKADKQVVMAAVTQDGKAIRLASPDLSADLEVKLIIARHGSATAALKIVRQLKNLPVWEDRHKEVDRAVELLASFPISQTSPKVHRQLHNLVEGMVKHIFKPEIGRGAKRDRAAFEEDFRD